MKIVKCDACNTGMNSPYLQPIMLSGTAYDICYQCQDKVIEHLNLEVRDNKVIYRQKLEGKK